MLFVFQAASGFKQQDEDNYLFLRKRYINRAIQPSEVAYGIKRTSHGKGDDVVPERLKRQFLL